MLDLSQYYVYGLGLFSVIIVVTIIVTTSKDTVKTKANDYHYFNKMYNKYLFNYDDYGIPISLNPNNLNKIKFEHLQYIDSSKLIELGMTPKHPKFNELDKNTRKCIYRKYNYIQLLERYPIPDKFCDISKDGSNNFGTIDGYSYVYEYHIDDKVVYIGKGSKTYIRALDIWNHKYCRKYTKDIIIHIVKHFNNTNDALKYESELIKYYGINNLLNKKH